MLDNTRGLQLDLDAARRHLELVAGEADPVVAWQVFDDSKADRTLAAGFHGRLDAVLSKLQKAQREGCGVYVAVNATDGKRRKMENMVAARALFLDLDGAPLPETWPVEPDLIVHSSSLNGIDKYQVWWMIDPTEDWGRWIAMQKALARHYGGDPKCTLVTQVGRCAGFLHQKDPAQPWQVRIIHDPGADPAIRHDLDRLVERFGLDLTDEVAAPRAARDREPPPHGWDSDLDVAEARRLLANEDNWTMTSDGAVSVFKMACWLRDLGISQGLAVELIEEFVPALPDAADHDPHYVVRKVANAFRYASGEAGELSREAGLHDFDDVPLDPEDFVEAERAIEAERRAMIAALDEEADDGRD